MISITPKALFGTIQYLGLLLIAAEVILAIFILLVVFIISIAAHVLHFFILML